MSFLKRAAGFAAATARSVGSTVNVLTGGISVKTEDIPISPVVVDSLTLSDVQKWLKQNVQLPGEPLKVAVVRDRHGQLWKVSYVVLNQRNKRSFDSEGKLRAEAKLVRTVSAELEEFFGNQNSVLISF